jgi:hypothetical protein
MIFWNTNRILEMAGGTTGVIALCARVAPMEVPPNPATVAVWRFRGRISSKWLPVILSGLLHMPADLFVDGEATPSAAPVPSLEDAGL